MRTNKPYAALLLLLVISLVFSACSAAATAEPAAPTRTPSAALTSTAAPTRTPAPTQAAPLPTATWTQQPSPTASQMTSLPPTNVPLSADGPWLLLRMDDSDPDTTADYLVMNADGSGLQPLGLPAVPDRLWDFLSTPGGPFLAFRTYPKEGHSINIKADNVDAYVWILKLPENQVVRKLPLLSEAAWQVIHDAQVSHPDDFAMGYNLPTQLGLVVNGDSFKWSPSRRYLAYSAALDGQGTDLYLYDTLKNTTRRLTTGRSGAQVWLWSPDESTVIYTNGSLTNIAYASPELSNLDGRYAVDLASGSERKLYQPPLSGEKVWYTSEQDFIVSDSGHESDFSNLRRVNFKTGAIRTLFEGHFTAGAVAEGQTVLLSLDPTHGFSSVSERINPGLYRLNLTTGQPDLIREGHFGWVDYETSLHLFSVLEDTGSSGLQIALLDAAGQEKLRLPDAYDVAPSPDGQWIIGIAGIMWQVYNLSGQAQTKENWGTPVWLNDSSGFYTGDCDPGIQFYPQASAWQPAPIYRGGCRDFSLLQKP